MWSRTDAGVDLVCAYALALPWIAECSAMLRTRKITMSHGRRQRSHRASMRLLRSLRSCRRGCGSSTRVNSKGARNASRPHLVRAPQEPLDERLEAFYDRLLAALRRPALRQGNWQLLDCTPAWEGNWTWDCFLVFAWQGAGDERLLVTVNHAPNQSQCYVRLPFADLGDGQWRLEDVIGDATYAREGVDLEVSTLAVGSARRRRR